MTLQTTEPEARLAEALEEGDLNEARQIWAEHQIDMDWEEGGLLLAVLGEPEATGWLVESSQERMLSTWYVSVGGWSGVVTRERWSRDGEEVRGYWVYVVGRGYHVVGGMSGPSSPEAFWREVHREIDRRERVKRIRGAHTTHVDLVSVH